MKARESALLSCGNWSLSTAERLISKATREEGARLRSQLRLGQLTCRPTVWAKPATWFRLQPERLLMLRRPCTGCPTMLRPTRHSLTLRRRVSYPHPLPQLHLGQFALESS